MPSSSRPPPTFVPLAATNRRALGLLSSLSSGSASGGGGAFADTTAPPAPSRPQSGGPARNTTTTTNTNAWKPLAPTAAAAASIANANSAAAAATASSSGGGPSTSSSSTVASKPPRQQQNALKPTLAATPAASSTGAAALASSSQQPPPRQNAWKTSTATSASVSRATNTNKIRAPNADTTAAALLPSSSSMSASAASWGPTAPSGGAPNKPLSSPPPSSSSSSAAAAAAAAAAAHTNVRFGASAAGGGDGAWGARRRPGTNDDDGNGVAKAGTAGGGAPYNGRRDGGNGGGVAASSVATPSVRAGVSDTAAGAGAVVASSVNSRSDGDGGGDSEGGGGGGWAQVVTTKNKRSVHHGHAKPSVKRRQQSLPGGDSTSSSLKQAAIAAAGAGVAVVNSTKKKGGVSQGARQRESKRKKAALSLASGSGRNGSTAASGEGTAQQKQKAKPTAATATQGQKPTKKKAKAKDGGGGGRSANAMTLLDLIPRDSPALVNQVGAAKAIGKKLNQNAAVPGRGAGAGAGAGANAGAGAAGNGATNKDDFPALTMSSSHSPQQQQREEAFPALMSSSPHPTTAATAPSIKPTAILKKKGGAAAEAKGSGGGKGKGGKGGNASNATGASTSDSKRKKKSTEQQSTTTTAAKKKKERKQQQDPAVREGSSGPLHARLLGSTSATKKPHPAEEELRRQREQFLRLNSTTGGGGGDGVDARMAAMLLPPGGSATGMSATTNATEGTVKKGRQRVKPRKKKLTTLKKRVLRERLDAWRAAHPEVEAEKKTSSSSPVKVDDGGAGESTLSPETGPSPSQAGGPFVVRLTNFVQPDEIEDDDEHDEVASDLRDMATKVGSIRGVYVPRDDDGAMISNAAAEGGARQQQQQQPSDVGPCVGQAYVCFDKSRDAAAAQSCWDGMVLGGHRVVAHLVEFLPTTEALSSAVSLEEDMSPQWWKRLLDKARLVEAVDGESSARAFGAEQPTSSVADGASQLNNAPPTEAATVELRNALCPEDLDDEECLQESLDDLSALARRHGPVLEVTASTDDNDADPKGIVLVRYQGKIAAQNAANEFDGMVLGGEIVSARILESASGDMVKVPETPTTNTIVLESILTEDDLEDEECLQESIDDIKSLAQQYGTVADVRAEIDKSGGTGCVLVTYQGGTDVAYSAIRQLDGMTIGGTQISAKMQGPEASQMTSSLDESNASNHSGNVTIVLENLLTEDDLDDEECLQESIDDISEVARRFGIVSEVNANIDNESKGGLVYITYKDDDKAVSDALRHFNDAVVGGLKVSARIHKKDHPENGAETVDEERKESDPAEASSPPPMFSGDKIIPEKYAECKRVPKIPNPGKPREYASRINDETAIPLIFEMLGELMRLQLRSKDDKNAKARRRLVMGLREVARGIRAHKVKMVVMANNLDEYGAIDDKLQEILDLANEEDVPVLFELNKRKLGKALGKSIKVSVVGVQNADGAYPQFKALKKLLGSY